MADDHNVFAFYPSKTHFKNEAPPRFELGISCLLDRRFNQLSHGAIHAGIVTPDLVTLEHHSKA